MKITEILATVGGLGHLRPSPGTYGSVPGLLLGVLTHHFLVNVCAFERNTFFVISSIIGLAFCVLAHFTIVQMEKTWRHDDKRIVIDELAGQYFSTVFFPLTPINIIASFALFRFFDIAKPWPIRWIDRQWKHPFATLADDLLAALFSIATMLILVKIGL